jgi:hypothetical protein
MRREALEDLDFMNINYATLFPGLEGFAKSLAYLTDESRDKGHFIHQKKE